MCGEISIIDHTDTTPYSSRQPIYDIPLALLDMKTSFFIGAK
jgi:hypothetical protein